jgi:phospholipase C
MTPDELRSHIDTIVIVMMENRSFDHMLGCLRLPRYGGRADVNGIEELGNPAYANPSQNATMAAPFIAANDNPLTNDLPHTRRYVAQQLADAPVAGRFAMNGFVSSYERYTGTTGVLDPPPMSMLPPQLMPITHFFAREFTLCDHWHASLPASTQPNRLMALSGDVFYDENQHGLLDNQDLIFDWLDRNRVRWRVYTAGVSFLALMPKMWPALLTDRFKSLSALVQDVQHERDSEFPQVVFVEPDYDDLPVHLSGHACDNHPPVPVAYGEAFLKRVYDALTSSPHRWGKTVIIYTYDEHGGFFDHVPPPRIGYAPPVGAHFAAPFTSLGPRVPALVISPFAEAGGVHHDTLDHTSILQLLAERFSPNPASYSRSVDSRRAAGIGSVARALGTVARPSIPQAPEPPAVLRAAGPRLRPPVTDAQHSYVAAIEGLSQRHPRASDKYPEIAHWQAHKPR